MNDRNSLARPTSRFRSFAAAAALLAACASTPEGKAPSPASPPGATATTADPGTLAALLLDAEYHGRPTPVLSIHNPGLTMAQAYAVQRAYVAERRVQEAVFGYKAGLTAKGGQAKFGVDGPLSGVLFMDGAHASGARFAAADYGKLMLETELAFVLARDVTAPVTTTAAARDLVAAVAPAIELPDLGFADPAALTGADIVAANVAAAAVLVGPEADPAGLDVDRIEVSLLRDGEPVHTGNAREAMGGQWTALRWLLNNLLANGYRPRTGEVLITGALGDMQPAVPGSYRAEFGPLGTVAFTIDP